MLIMKIRKSYPEKLGQHVALIEREQKKNRIKTHVEWHTPRPCHFLWNRLLVSFYEDDMLLPVLYGLFVIHGVLYGKNPVNI